MALAAERMSELEHLKLQQKSQPTQISVWVLSKFVLESIESQLSFFHSVSRDLVINLPTIKHACERLDILRAGCHCPQLP